MAKPAQVIVEIDEDGNVTVEAQNFTGSGCKKHLDAFRGLGEVTDERLKPEFYKSPNTHVLSNVRNG